MLKVQNIVLKSDIDRLPREIIRDIAVSLGVAAERSFGEIVDNIWEKLLDDHDLRHSVLEPVKHKILCGKTSVTWYTFSEETSLEGVRELIIRNSSFNPFQEIRVPVPDSLTSTPVLIGAAQGETEHEYYLRFMRKCGVVRYYHGYQSQSLPTTEAKTIYVNEAQGCIEIRTDARTSDKYARFLGQLINQERFIFTKDILAPFGNNIESIADQLDGELIDVIARPELLVEDFSEEQAVGVINILTAMNDFFVNNDFDILRRKLQEAREQFEDSFLSVPFTALILNGLEKVGMGVPDKSNRELRGLPFYDFLRPHLQHQGGFIRFKVTEYGMENSYTIRVGLSTKSIYFMTPATENAIKFVMDRLVFTE